MGNLNKSGSPNYFKKTTLKFNRAKKKKELSEQLIDFLLKHLLTQ